MSFVNFAVLAGLPVIVPDSNAPGHDLVQRIGNAVAWFVLVAIAIMLLVFVFKLVASFWNDDTSGRNSAIKGILACGVGVFLIGGGGRALIDTISNYLG